MDTHSRFQLPPGQQLVAAGKWPIIGERAPAAFSGQLQDWTLSISGLVRRPIQLTLPQMLSRPLACHSIDIHCVTRWSKLGVMFEGIPLKQIIEAAQPSPSAQFVNFRSHSNRNHSSSLSLSTALSQETLIALKVDGQPLSLDHGGPVRNIVPGRYFYKSVKWLTGIEFLAKDELGFWEAESGYHNEADPWKEQRYIASKLDRREIAALLASRDFSDRDLMGISADNRNLTGLQACRSLLRNADFRKSDLSGSDFRLANLSNANLQDAILRDCNFEGADLEGANFSGADLSGANLLGCSLIGCSFFDPDLGAEQGARFDPQTQLGPAEIAPLFPEQFAYVDRQFQTLGWSR